jgi:hypothetical protein
MKESAIASFIGENINKKSFKVKTDEKNNLKNFSKRIFFPPVQKNNL